MLRSAVLMRSAVLRSAVLTVRSFLPVLEISQSPTGLTSVLLIVWPFSRARPSRRARWKLFGPSGAPDPLSGALEVWSCVRPSSGALLFLLPYALRAIVCSWRLYPVPHSGACISGNRNYLWWLRTYQRNSPVYLDFRVSRARPFWSGVLEARWPIFRARPRSGAVNVDRSASRTRPPSGAWEVSRAQPSLGTQPSLGALESG